MKRPQLAVPAAAACAALLFSGCTNGSTDPEPGASTGPSLNTMPADEAAALAAIDQAYAAFNSGDAARWAAARSAGGEYESDEARDAELLEATQFFEERIAAGVRFTAIQCVSHGRGQWAGIADAQAPVQGYYFTCEHNDGSGTHVTKWLVADDKVVAAGSD